MRRGQQHNRRNQFSNGDYCLGYSSRVAPGQEARIGQKGFKPRKVIVIDEETRWVVEAIFSWFVCEQRSIQWIVRELNRMNAPKDHRASRSKWSRKNVLSVLGNAKYVGLWKWGKTRVVRNPNTGAKSQVPRPAEDYEQHTWVRPELAFIEPDVFAQAQDQLAANRAGVAIHRNRKGQLAGSRKGQFGRRAQHLLQGLMLCPGCQAPLYTTGSRKRGHMLYCPNGRNGSCECRHGLNRELAERVIIAQIGNILLQDPNAQKQVLQHTLKASEQQPSASDSIDRIEREIEKAQSKIERLLDRLEEGEDADIRRRLQERQRERDALRLKLDAARSRQSRTQKQPDAEWVSQQLEDLARLLREDVEQANAGLKRLIPEKISLRLQSSDRNRPHLEAQFTVCVNLLASLDSAAESAPNGCCFECLVDLMEGNEARDHEMQEARRLYDEDWLNVDIAKHLNCSKAKVTALLKASFAAERRTMPDGRSRRSQLPKKQQAEAVYEQVAEQAVAEWNAGKSYREIGRLCGCADLTARKAIQHWHEVRNLPVPTVDSRREEQLRTARQLYEAEVPQTEISRQIGVTMTTLRKWLREMYESEGQTLPDGRQRRWRSNGSDRGIDRQSA